MTPRLLNLLTALSLVMCVAACVLWARSYRRLDRVMVGGRYELASWLGGLHYLGLDRELFPTRLQPHSTPLPAGLSWDGAQYANPAGGPRTRWAGLIVVTAQPLGAVGARPIALYTAVRVPHWATVVATAALPAAWVARRFRARRNRAAGLCAQCGYDLRASPGRCPECGAVGGTAR